MYHMFAIASDNSHRTECPSRKESFNKVDNLQNIRRKKLAGAVSMAEGHRVVGEA